MSTDNLISRASDADRTYPTELQLGHASGNPAQPITHTHTHTPRAIQTRRQTGPFPLHSDLIHTGAPKMIHYTFGGVLLG